jgi:tetrahydromethanopterin S-methyltransferase subunit A
MTSRGKPAGRQRAVEVVREQLAKAVAAAKCHRCGCLRQTVEALAGTSAGQAELGGEISNARAVYVEKEYECLGCKVCFPAIAANAFAEAFPEESETLDLCPTEEPRARAGWPPLAGDYHVVRYRAPVAACTLNSDELAEELAAEAPDGLAVSGTMHTENLGIERVIQNVLANPHIRFLVLCGEDTQQAIGHLARGRIEGARGKRPILKNVSAEQVEAFRKQVELLSLIGEEDVLRVRETVSACAGRTPGPFEGAPVQNVVETVWSEAPSRLVPDPAGFFVVYPEARRQILIIEHYTKHGVLDCVVEGRTPAAISAEVIGRRLITRLDHAAYLGRELARAERSMQTGETYVQDRAPGDIEGEEQTTSCSCSGSCS